MSITVLFIKFNCMIKYGKKYVSLYELKIILRNTKLKNNFDENL